MLSIAGIPRRRHGHGHGHRPTPTCQTRLQSYVRHTLFPREDPREDVRVGVGVGVGVVEFQLIRA